MATSSPFDFAAVGNVVGKIADAFSTIETSRAAADAARARANAEAAATARASSWTSAPTAAIGGLNLGALVPIVGLVVVGSLLLKMLGRR